MVEFRPAGLGFWFWFGLVLGSSFLSPPSVCSSLPPCPHGVRTRGKKIVFKNCGVILPSQEQLEGCPIHHVPLAVHVPLNPEEIVPEGAFAGVPRLRHVSVE